MAPTLVLLTGPPGTGKSTLAEAAAERLGAAVLGWDWAMAALTGFPTVQGALADLPRERYRAVGWSLLANLAAAQLRAGRSVVLDGVARTGEVAAARQVARAAGADAVVVLTTCSDPVVHRQRVEGRVRDIPGWHELTWDRVAQALDGWVPPSDVDLVFDAVVDREVNAAVLAALLDDHRW